MEAKTEPGITNKIFTVPNILTMLRLLLIPVFVWLYCFRKNYTASIICLLFSGATDIADGYIARHFQMVSDLGKALDPIADKLTQGVTLICLGTRFQPMLFLGIALLVKETIAGIHSLYAVKKTNQVKGADWHGKVLTCLLYVTMVLHILWINIPSGITVSLVVLCLSMMMISFILYLRRNIEQIRESRHNSHRKEN